MVFNSEQVVWFMVLAGVVAFPAALIAMLLRAGAARGTAWAAAATLAAWLAVVTVAAARGAFEQSPVEPRPWIAVVVLAGTAATLLAAGTPALSGATGDPSLLTRPQVVRVVGAVFLVAWAAGTLPAVFALPAGLGDVAVGVAALRVARTGRGLRAFQVLGLLDLAVAVTIGFLAGLGPARLLDVTPSTAAVSRLPLVLIPAFLVPLAAALHLRALVRLRSAVPARAVVAE